MPAHLLIHSETLQEGLTIMTHGTFGTWVNSFQRETNQKPQITRNLTVSGREEIETKTFILEPFHYNTPYFDDSFRPLLSSLNSLKNTLFPGSISEASATAPDTVPRRVLTECEPAA